jgi:two-component system, response regulator RegA
LEIQDCTVLIVDTDARIVRGFAQSLRAVGYKVFEATSFEDGKRLWLEHLPAVLVVDVRLGQFNGLQLVMRARSDRPLVKAIVTSPFADPVLEAETQRFGGTFMIKPVSSPQIVFAVENAASSDRKVPNTPPMLLERRREERRKKNVPISWVDRRSRERRTLPLPADTAATNPQKPSNVTTFPDQRPRDKRLTKQ